MQATLLSIAIALILALVTALVGPHFVDWNKYRAEFETQASRMTGLQRARRRSDRRPAAADAVAEPVAHRHRARRRRGRLAAGAPAQHRVFARFPGARRIQGDRRDPGGRRDRDRARPQRPPGLAGAVGRLRSGGDLDRAPRHPRQPRAAGRRRQRLRHGARQARFQGRAAHAVRPGQGPGLVLRRRPALSLSRSRPAGSATTGCACGSTSTRSTGR